MGLNGAQHGPNSGPFRGSGPTAERLQNRDLVRVSAVNGAQRAPTRPNARAPGGGLSDRFRWVALGPVATHCRLITQRSLVQIQPPQPIKSTGYNSMPSPLC